MKGVVHVGAHKGEEVAGYLEEGRDPIICFEPQNFGIDIPKVNFVICGLSNENGILSLKTPRHLHSDDMDTQSATGLELIPELATSIGWIPTQFDVTYVPFIRFDHWAKHSGFISGSCDLLVIDVQGMELQVLKGFGDYLKDFTTLKVECSRPPIYEGGSDALEVILFLERMGFTNTSPVLPHGDIYFTRMETQ